MTTRTCQQCGTPIAEAARFCGACGTPVPEPSAIPPETGAAAPFAAKTMIQMGPPPAASTSGLLGKTTMLRFTSPVKAPLSAPAGAPGLQPGAVGAMPAGAPAHAPATPAFGKGTMIGMASPVVLPAPAPPAQPPSAPQPLPAPAPPAGPASQTGAAPPRSAAPAPPPRNLFMTVPIQVAMVPVPEPLPELQAPPPPRIVRPKGVPLATVGLIVGGLLLVGGGVIALLWKAPPPIVATAHSSQDGKDVLHLACDPKSCADGTTASADGAKATFAAGEAELVLAKALRVGENDLTLVIDRPKMGRDESVKLRVAVAYRVRADVSTMTAEHPAITVRVEALPGTDVRVDDKPVPLDLDGNGAYAVDETASTEGPADESRVVSVDVPYVIAPKGGAAQRGTASARVSVAPLRVDAPLAGTVQEDGRVVVAGRAAKGASVSVDGAPAVVQADGSFEATVALDGPGDKTIVVCAGTSALMPRSVRVTVKRVASLAAAASDFEKKGPLDYDAAMRDLQGATGKPMVVEGPVVDVKTVGRRSVILMDDRRGCRGGNCVVPVVVVGDGAPPHPGEKLRAYGTIARALNSSGKTVPQVEAQFLVRASH